MLGALYVFVCPMRWLFSDREGKKKKESEKKKVLMGMKIGGFFW